MEKILKRIFDYLYYSKVDKRLTTRIVFENLSAFCCPLLFIMKKSGAGGTTKKSLKILFLAATANNHPYK